MRILIQNIKELVQIIDNDSLKISGKEMASLKTIKNAYLIIENELISAYGTMADFGTTDILISSFDEVIDATGKMVFPAFVDSHTHLVYAGSREVEYIDKIKGLSYEEIAKRGGGILNSAKRIQNISIEELYNQSQQRLKDIISMGTGAVEIKSGYGLSLESELKMLETIKLLKKNSPLSIRATFLGAHAVPAEYRGKQSEYVKVVVNEMIPKVGEEKLADFVDVFCDKGFFTVDETAEILEAAQKYGMIPKIHANELDYSGGIQVGVNHSALSVDHLEFTGDDEIKALLNSGTMPTLLPGAAFFLGMVYAPARKMIDAGLPIALASDFNPGSSPSGNMQLIAAMGSIMFKMLSEEVIHSTTINTAYAMGLSDKLGSISIGKIANLIITKPMPTYHYWTYSYGDNKVDTMILNGIITKTN
jgi:imidazolonepropionase